VQPRLVIIDNQYGSAHPG